MSNKRNEKYMTSSNLDSGGFVGAVSGQHSSIGRLNWKNPIRVAGRSLWCPCTHKWISNLHRFAPVKVGPQKVQPSERVNRMKPLHTRWNGEDQSSSMMFYASWFQKEWSFDRSFVIIFHHVAAYRHHYSSPLKGSIPKSLSNILAAHRPPDKDPSLLRMRRDFPSTACRKAPEAAVMLVWTCISLDFRGFSAINQNRAVLPGHLMLHLHLAQPRC